MIIEKIKGKLQEELAGAKCIWIASAMISNSGWRFIQENISQSAVQHFLIGIDLATDPSVFERILENLEINARVYESSFTFHPKVYIIQRIDGSLTAFIGSSNTTSWGFEKNVEMNFQINDKEECQKLIWWFESLFNKAYLVTREFFENYKDRFVRSTFHTKQIEIETAEIKKIVLKGVGQFFSHNDHEVFQEKYHYIENESLYAIRGSVREKFKKLHRIIFPQFADYGLFDLHHHSHTADIVSRHYFNQYSGNYINAMWLHYGKSPTQLSKYKGSDDSSFINNIRMQVIIHEDSVGIWLMLGRKGKSWIDRNHFREQMNDPDFRQRFFLAFQNLGGRYWINIHGAPPSSDIKDADRLAAVVSKETIDDYFIIGLDINWLSKDLSDENIAKTVLEEFRNLYPLYELMRHT